MFPLGDSALTIDFGNLIDPAIHQNVQTVYHLLKKAKLQGVYDIIPAYSSVTICYDMYALRPGNEEKTCFDVLAEKIEHLTAIDEEVILPEPKKISVPVCYSRKFAPDLEFLAEQKEMNIEEIIELHTSATYTVYMLGFLPGFAYMGEVDERIAIPRKTQPRAKLAAGSVGIAGRQTGIYPLPSPGGWQIIGRTPLQLFTKHNAHPALFAPGNEVRFYSITEDEFANYQSRNS
jgi:inhibitor of KinA